MNSFSYSFLIGDDFIDNLSVVEDTKVENLIYEIRGVQVMLDSDLAKLYQCVNGTKTINQSYLNRRCHRSYWHAAWKFHLGTLPQNNLLRCSGHPHLV